MTVSASKQIDHGNSVGCRADAYALLAALLRRPPDQDLLSIIADADCPAEVPEPFHEAWGELRKACSQTTPEAIDNEFIELFGGAGRGVVVPYASWYREGLLMGRALALLRQDLARLGIAKRKVSREAEDHAALICETLALLNRDGTLSADAYAGFFDRHVASWMFDFFSDIQKAASADFYGRVSTLGIRLLQWENANKGA